MNFQKLMDYRTNFQGFSKEVGIRYTELRDGYAKAELPIIQEKHGNTIGSVQGGALFTLADSVGGTAALSRGNLVTTMTGDINYLNAGIGTKMLTAEAMERKAGNNILVYDVDICDEKGTLIACARMTYFSLKKKLVL